MLRIMSFALKLAFVCYLLCQLLGSSLAIHCSQELEGHSIRHISKCNAYFECLRGEFVQRTCRIGYYFNGVSRRCEVDNGQCSGIPCEEGLVIANTDNCAAYFQCLNGKIVARRCPMGSYFEARWMVCIVDDHDVCMPKHEHCHEGELEDDSVRCDAYFTCVDGEYESRVCPTGQYFNATLMACTEDVHGNCAIRAEQCTEGELEDDTDRCAGYFRCINGDFVSQTCEDGSYFDVNAKSCVIDRTGFCVENHTTCIEGDMVEDPDYCASYLQCIDGELVSLSCPHGESFDADTKQCRPDERGIYCNIADK